MTKTLVKFDDNQLSEIVIGSAGLTINIMRNYFHF